MIDHVESAAGDIRRHLAIDEAALEQLDMDPAGRPSLRFWESPSVAVVVGRSSRLDVEVDIDRCRRDNVPVVRRPSGGAAVVVGPGCLLYSLVLSRHRQPELAHIDAAHRLVLDTNSRALSTLGAPVACNGISDLTLGGRKISGNSLRCKANAILYHGTILYDMRLDLIPNYLRMPPRQPDYRNGRSHGAFVANLPATRDAIERALVHAWNATRSATVDAVLLERVAYWLQVRYHHEKWHLLGKTKTGPG